MPTLEAVPAATSFVELTRATPASRSRVYEMWTDSALLKQWFGPATMHCTSVSLDARTGGAYSIAVRPNDAPDSVPDAVASGTYTRVIPGELLQFTWKPSWRAGEDSLVTISFADALGEGTEITIRHENFTEDALDNYTNGWTACLDKLEAAANFV
jgi:uncharacterized protein YndB with AHSA1/START domain